jgi:serine/threonine protein kinase
VVQIEQLHKIFKLCGSPSEDYWAKAKLPDVTLFKPQRPYRRRIAETFRDFPSTALDLLDTLLAIEPSYRGTAASALDSEVIQQYLVLVASYVHNFCSY